jgi:hypothetical protein
MGNLKARRPQHTGNVRVGTVPVKRYMYCHSSAAQRSDTSSSLVRIVVHQNAQQHFRSLLHGYPNSSTSLQCSGPATIYLREKNANRRNNICSTRGEFTCTRSQYLRGCVNLMFVCGFHYLPVHVPVS